MLSISLPSSSFTSVHLKSPKPLAGKLSISPESVKFRRSSAVSATASPETAASSLYEVLEISIAATNEEIKAAYRRLARSCHPDVAAGEERQSTDEFIRVHAAYSVLSDPEKRADYDRKMSQIIRPSTRQFPGLSASPTSSFCRAPRRNWETDQCWWDNSTSVVTPNEEVFYLVALLRTALENGEETQTLEYLTSQNRKILNFCKQAKIGVKQYLPHYTTQQEWIDHFGDKWDRFYKMKMQFDPKHILSTGQRIFGPVVDVNNVALR